VHRVLIAENTYVTYNNHIPRVQLKKRTDDNAMKGVVPFVHDESMLNWYCTHILATHMYISITLQR
jgi:hypothetical protein